MNENAQHYRLPPKISAGLGKRQEDNDPGHLREVKKISWKCQNRLYEKGKKLSANHFLPGIYQGFFARLLERGRPSRVRKKWSRLLEVMTP